MRRILTGNFHSCMLISYLSSYGTFKDQLFACCCNNIIVTLYACVHYRCVSPNNTDATDFVSLCERYYGYNNGYFNGTEITGLQEAWYMINGTFQSGLEDNPCIELMENYLCHYYFPSCNVTTGEITPVCRSSCALLLNNQDCAELREIANEQLKQHNVTPPGDKCLQTHSMYVNSLAVSENCLSIEG